MYLFRDYERWYFMAMANVRIIKLTRDTIFSWGRPLYEFLKRQDPKDYSDYLLPLSGGDRDYNRFASKLTSLVADQDLALNDGHVPTDYWLVVVANFIIGTAKTRYLLDSELVHEGGHVRLGLDPEFRGQGYGHEAFGLLLEECRRNHDLNDVMVTVLDSNERMLDIVESYGGSWESEATSIFRREKFSRYWIHFPVKVKE